MKRSNNLLENKIVAGLLAIFCCLLWGSAFPCIKIGYILFGIESGEVTKQILFAGIRFFIAGILTILFGSIIKKQLLFPKKDSYRFIAILSIFQTIVQYFFFYVGLAHSTGVKSSIINGMGTFFAIIIASLIFKQEKLSQNKLIGCILGIIGVIVVNFNSIDVGQRFALNGEGFILIAAISYGFSSVLIKIFSKKEDPVVLSGYQFMLGGAVMIIVALLCGARLQNTGWSGILLLLYMAFISAVAYTLWGILLKYNSVSSITIYGFTNPIFGAILSAIFLSEISNLNYTHILALALVSLGIFIVNLP